MILMNPIHEFDAVHVKCNFGKKHTKMGTRERKNLSLLTYLISMRTILADNKNEFQLKYR